ncbi:hypothetical protein GT034_17405 [Streptomyces sp. SID2563]|uniref:DUF7224 domain-containing protein n=1 Tax=Streptomyces sp. SID2563 TaxID=2690255 RepID=UPI001369C76C|nr:hypothetical protein [Streptomyces sp. SID2563]MYW10113.1 hypothetical protein [Streptomyces sp. SID2563]
MIYAYLYIDDATFTAPSMYGVESGELASHALAIVVPGVAVCAAWEAGRHRLLGPLARTGRRSILRQSLHAATPVLLLMVVLVAGTMLMARHAVGVWPSGAGWLAVAHLVVLCVGWTVCGWSLGLLMPRSIAAPLCGIGCWAWLATTHAMAAPWIRHLGGFIDGNSTVNDLLDPAVYYVPWGVVAGFALSLSVLARMRPRGWAAPLAIALLACTVIVGRSAVVSWGYGNPHHPRHVALTCAGAKPEVCVPPEYAPYAAQLRRRAIGPIAKLHKAGLPTPQELRITSEDLPLSPGIWPLRWSLPLRGGHEGPSEFAVDLAESAVTGTAVRAGVKDCRQQGSPAAAWAALVAGVAEEDMQKRMSPSDWAELQKIRSLSVSEQADWFIQAAVNQRHCVEGVS